MAFTSFLILSLAAAVHIQAQFATTTNFGGGATNFGAGATNFGTPTTNFAGNTGGLTGNTLGAYPGSTNFGGYPQYPTGSRLPTLNDLSNPNYGFPSFGGPRRGSTLLTVRAYNKAGDHLYLTIEPEDDDDFYDDDQYGRNPYANPYASLFGRRSSQGSRSLRVHGVFYKAGGTTGVPSQDSLHGKFAMLVFTNGNTDAYCVGTGQPYRVDSGSRNPYNPYGNFGSSNPFSQYLPNNQGYNYGRVVAVSTPLQAHTTSATIEGRIRGVTASQIVGRSIQVTADAEGRIKTDLCGVIARDDKTIEEFQHYQQQQAALQNSILNQQGLGGTVGGVGGTNFGTVGGVGGVGGNTFGTFPATGTTNTDLLGNTGNTGGTAPTTNTGGLF